MFDHFTTLCMKGLILAVKFGDDPPHDNQESLVLLAYRWLTLSLNPVLAQTH